MPFVTSFVPDRPMAELRIQGRVSMSLGIRTQLMTATALAAVGLFASQSAMAQSAPAAEGAASDKSKSSAPVAAEDILKDIVVSGRQRAIAGGLMIVQRQPETTNSISAEAIKQKMGIAGPYQLVATLPGVNTGQSDPYQMSIRYALQLRGLPMNKIGWVVDGVNAMDRAYLQPYSETYADNENLAGLTILPGSTRITDPVQTAVAGEFSMTIRDPEDKPGAQASYGYGSYQGQRIFAGIDTGLIGHSGIKAFGSISYTQAGTFALPKDAIGKRLHVDFKIAKDWGDLGKSSLFLSYGDWSAVRSQAYTLAQFRADQATGDFTAGNYLSSFNPQSNTNNYWKYAVYTRRNLLLAWNNELHPTDKIDLHITPYYQWIFSNSPGESALNPNSVYAGSQKQAVDTTGLFLLPNGNIPVKTNVLQRQFATSVNTSAKVRLTPSNNITFGWWYDHWQMTQLNSFSPIAAGGDAPDWASTILRSTSSQAISGANYSFNTNINALSVQDAQSFLDDKLKVEVGLKYFIYRLSGQNLLPGTQSAMNFRYEKLLPRATVSYDINSKMQVYANIVTETRTNAPITTYPNTYNATTGAISQLGNPSAKPEHSLGEEIGYRYHDGLLTADVALFNKKLDNNSVTSLAFLNGAGVNSAYNAGGLIMRGATFELALKSFWGFSPYVNGQYLWTRNSSNFQVGNDFLPTAGKEGVQAPKYTATVGLDYKHGPFFGNVIYKYTASQYTTFMNDQKMPAYGTVDLGFGYHIPAGYVGNEPVIRVSVTNLTNKPYLGASSSVQPNAVTTTGINGTVIAGAAPSYWLSSPRAIMGTFSTKF